MNNLSSFLESMIICLLYHALSISRSFSKEKLIRQTMQDPIIPMRTCLWLSVKRFRAGLISK